MPLDARARRFLQTLAAMSPTSALSLSVSERRAGLTQLMSFSGRAPQLASVEDRTLPGPDGALVVRIYTPEAALAPVLLPALVYFHGGGLVAGSLDTHDAICRALAAASGWRVLALDYRLAPEHRFPAAIADGCTAVTWIATHSQEWGVDRRRLGICGDSAGATLAAVVCQALVSSAQVPLALQLLLCPITDFAGSTESRRALAEGYLVDEATLQHDLRYYLSPADSAADPRVSPLRAADLATLPPTIVHTAEYDPLRDEGEAYAERLRAAGVKTIYRCHPGMIHLFYGMGGLIPYAATAFQQMGTDIRSLLGEL